VTSALRDGMRVVSVVLGSKSFKGARMRAAHSSTTRSPFTTQAGCQGGAKLASAPVWKAAATPIDVGVNEDLYITRAQRSGDIKTTVDVRPSSSRPCRTTTTRSPSRGRRIADFGDRAVHPLTAVAQGGWWRRLIDTIRFGSRKLRTCRCPSVI